MFARLEGSGGWGRKKDVPVENRLIDKQLRNQGKTVGQETGVRLGRGEREAVTDSLALVDAFAGSDLATER